MEAKVAENPWRLGRTLEGVLQCPQKDPILLTPGVALWPPDLCGNTVVLYEATRSVLIC